MTAKGRRTRRRTGESAANPGRWFAEFRRQLRDEQRQELGGLFLTALAGLMLFSLYSERAGALGDVLRQTLLALMGRGAVLIPVAVAAWGLASILRGLYRVSLPRRVGLALAVVTAAGFFHMRLAVPADAAFRIARLGDGGGLVGAAVDTALIRSFGPAGRTLLLYTAAAASLLLLIDVSVASLVRGAGARLLRLLAAGAAGLRTAVPPPATADGEVAGPAGPARPAGDGAGAGVAAGCEPDAAGDEPYAEEPPPVAEGFTETADSPATDAGAPPAGEIPEEVAGVAERPAPATPAAGTVATAASGGARSGTGAVRPFTQVPLDTGGLYQLPPVTLLSRQAGRGEGGGARDAERKRRVLEETLRSFGVEVRVVEIQRGPAVTRFEVQPGPGVKVARIASLADDIALSLAAPGVRIVAPIPGKAALGIEVPNSEVATVFLRDVLESREFQQSPSRLTLALGQDISGRPVVYSLEKMVHLLIAGATGSGKSVCVNGILCSLLFKATPAELRLMLIDPKVVELSGYNGIPHLLTPVVTDPRKAAGCLRWLLREMERRYEAFANAGVRDITRHNQAVAARGDRPMPFIVVVIDELADLMMVAPAEVEDAIQRLAQMARAAGIHLVVATQRPSVDVITGVIKANIPSRIAFAVSSQVDSRTILDTAGADKLLGKGDMLFHPMGAAKPTRVQGAYIPEGELEALLQYVRRQGQPEFDQAAMVAEATGESREEGWEDELFPDAVRVVLETGQASVSIVQRRLRVGYTRAGRLIDMMEERGIIGPHQGPKPREVLINAETYRRLFEGDRGTA